MNQYKIKRGKLWLEGKRFAKNDIVEIPEHVADSFGRAQLEFVGKSAGKSDEQLINEAKVKASKLVTNPAAKKDEKGIEVITPKEKPTSAGLDLAEQASVKPARKVVKRSVR